MWKRWIVVSVIFLALGYSARAALWVPSISLTLPHQMTEGKIPTATDHLQLATLRIGNTAYTLRLTSMQHVPHTDPGCDGYDQFAFEPEPETATSETKSE